MSLEAILSRIGKDAEEKSGSIVTAAEEEKENVLREHREKLEEEFARHAERLRSRMDESGRRREFHVRREAYRKLLNERRAMIDRAVERAVEVLAASDDSVYLAMISSLLEGCDLKGEVEVLISEADKSRITPSFLEKHSGPDRRFVLSPLHHDARGGVIFRSGDISQNGTFPMIAELSHEKLVMELSGLVPMEKN
ncbi:MAG: hypothetical protein AVO35_01605 [Candidatus Aegiribacteria sp. MLS_C]|nr:MAG: hypothetical protein AVO35_01605 [Candidatus Aegiribacteria sp. MLS_C]